MAEPLPSKKPGDEETLAFLKREEVRTMAKDIALLREEEAKKERERIAQIKTEGPKKGTQTQQPLPTSQPIPPSLMPHREEQKPVFLRAKTHPEKIIIRVIAIGVLLFILLNGLAFGYWYFTKPQPIVEESEPEPELTPVLTPVVFFDTAQEKTIEVAATDNLPLLLSDALKEEYPQGFTRIRLQNTEENVSILTREFLDKAAMAVSEPLLSLFQEDFVLFVYASPASSAGGPGRKRLGIITELAQTERVQDMLKSWETTLEEDTKQLWEIVGQKGSAYTPFFRQSVYQNNLVRFQTFSVLDFGIVYALSGTKLILTTSFESLTKAVDLLAQSR
jgi:hypothetical protein